MVIASEKRHFKILEKRGQVIAIDEDAKELFILIKEGPYLTAGRKFGWRGPGIGLNASILEHASNQNLKICIIVGNKTDRYYKAKIDADHWLSFSEKCKSIDYRHGIKIHILQFSRDYFETIVDPRSVSEILKFLRGC